MAEKTRYFCDIAPVVPVPLRNRQAYTYLSGRDLPRGTLVTVPFGPRTVRGIVLSSSAVADGTLPSGRLKPIRAVIRESFLTERQVSLAESVSSECLTPLGSTLRHFLPTPTSERSPKTPEAAKSVLRLAPEERDAAERIVGTSDGRPFFLETDIGKTVRIIVGMRRSAPKSAQILVLVPEILSAPFVERSMRDWFGNAAVATLHSALAAGPYFSAWERIRSGEATVVIGTRQALFAPYRNLAAIVVLEEGEAVGYKQWDMSPRYDARRVAKSLSLLHRAALVYTGSHQGLDTSFAERTGETRVIRMDETVETVSSVRVVTVDMRKERWKKNYSPISEELRERIAGARRSDRTVVLIASRGGMDSFSVCSNCKQVPRCPTCDRALRSTREGGFRCPSCSFRSDSFPRCTKCGSLEFRNVGAGTEKIEREAARLFGSSSVMRVDENTFRRAGRSESYDRITKGGILIGTASLLDIGPLPHVALTAILDADNMLSIPDFQADERFVMTVAKAESATDPSGTVLIQSFRPERRPIPDIVGRSMPELFRIVEKDRESLGYPPFRRFFRIGVRDVSPEAAETAAKEVWESLHARVPEGVEIKPPVRPLIGKVRGRYEFSILVTASRDASFPDTLQEALLESRVKWSFDPDPLTII
ncbi:MAG: primosomal protein N' [Candidatus Moranbacteria bacterium]|nr:primosomal protein N' [Candidatus Moranbacteria bacterium]